MIASENNNILIAKENKFAPLNIKIEKEVESVESDSDCSLKTDSSFQT